MRYMPLMFLVFLYNYSSGLALYLTVSTLLSVLQTKLTKMNQASGAGRRKSGLDAGVEKEKIIVRDVINLPFYARATQRNAWKKSSASLGFPATVEEHKLEDGLLLDVKTEDSGRLIGRQGQTLADLQYITNRLLFQQDATAPKVMVDVGGYRAQAREALVKKAKDAAEKVRRWGDAVELEPMTPLTAASCIRRSRTIPTWKRTASKWTARKRKPSCSGPRH